MWKQSSADTLIVAVSALAMLAIGTARADPAAQREHTRALAAQLIDAAKLPSSAKITAALETPLRYSLLTWHDETCQKKLPREGTVTRSALPAFVACLAKQDFSRVAVLVDDESLDDLHSSSYVRFKTAPTGRRLIHAIEFGIVLSSFGGHGLTGLHSEPTSLQTSGQTSGLISGPTPGADSADPAPQASGKGLRRVTIAFAEPSGDFGNLLGEEIDRVVKARAGVFRTCYQKELNRSPSISGKLVMRFKIGGDGLVIGDATATASGSTLRNDAVEQCVKINVNRLKFPAKGGVANVAFPFVFAQG